ncbi:MAG: hypothetical protein ACLQVJ_18845 [Syntrophobacteraceae bacterium]
MEWQKVVTTIALTSALVLGAIPGPAGLNAAGPPGVQLFVTPNKISFHMESPPSTAVREVTIRVIAPGRTPWRLTVQALGPLQSPKGSKIPASRVTWKGSPGHIFVDGTLSDKHPQLLGRGQGTKVGVVRFLLRNDWDLAAGQFNQKFLFDLSSP